MELDHVFIFTDSREEVAKALREFGLTEGSPNVHPGQGTACRRFYFQNAYLELVWVNNEDEVRSDPVKETRLWERSQYKHSGFCPAGLCLRDSKKEDKSQRLLIKDGWKYSPSFFPQGEYANIASNSSFPTEPMLFELPFFGLAPKDYPPHKRELMDHVRDFKEITRIIICVPGNIHSLSDSMKLVVETGWLEMVEEKEFAVKLEFDGCRKGEEQDFMHLLPLKLRW